MHTAYKLGYTLVKWAKKAKGIPDRKKYRSTADLKVDSIVDYMVQLHKARRAGTHRDIRLGDKGGLLSWATRKQLPAAGQRIGVFEQPTHSHNYLGFAGNIPTGYGAGSVSVEDLGKALINSSGPGHLRYTLTHKDPQESYTMAHPPAWGDRQWLMTNTTGRVR